MHESQDALINSILQTYRKKVKGFGVFSWPADSPLKPKHRDSSQELLKDMDPKQLKARLRILT